MAVIAFGRLSYLPLPVEKGSDIGTMPEWYYDSEKIPFYRCRGFVSV
ncbi:MAG: hypothetical protein JW774_12685 [Candidatus Aureabacteria bacterium]|nr:hypothetical protein [Candidatus Auribacterota bacterium]